MAAPGLEQGVDDFPRSLVGARMRLARPIEQTSRPLPLVALDPLVAGLAADAESRAQLRHRKQTLLVVGDEA